jgi:hypothetical protein
MNTRKQEKEINWPRFDYKQRARHKRWEQRVDKFDLICEECEGAGGWTEYIDRDIGGPWYDCGWCEGTGFVDPWRKSLWARTKKIERIIKVLNKKGFNHE